MVPMEQPSAVKQESSRALVIRDCLAQHCTHTPSIAFWHFPPNSARTGYATEGALFYLRAAVHRSGKHPPKGSGTDMTVEAT